MPSTSSVPDSTPQTDRRILAPLGLSLGLHALFLGLYAGLQQFPDSVPNPTLVRLDIRLQPAPGPVSPVLSPHTEGSSAPGAANPSRIVRHRPDETVGRHRITDDQAGASTIARSPNDESSAPSPSIDYAAARAIARQTAGSRHDPAAPKTELHATPPAEPETVLGRRINQAAHPDCRTRYADAGLLAIPLLINDAVSDSGCKW